MWSTEEKVTVEFVDVRSTVLTLCRRTEDTTPISVYHNSGREAMGLEIARVLGSELLGGGGEVVRLRMRR